MTRELPDHAGGEAGYFARVARYARAARAGRVDRGATIRRWLDKDRLDTPPEREPPTLDELHYMADTRPSLLTSEQWRAIGRRPYD